MFSESFLHNLIGEGAVQEQVVVGDTPVLGARLRSVVHPDTVIVAEATRRLLGDLFILQALSGESLKIFDGPIAALR